MLQCPHPKFTVSCLQQWFRFQGLIHFQKFWVVNGNVIFAKYGKLKQNLMNKKQTKNTFNYHHRPLFYKTKVILMATKARTNTVSE